MDSPKPSRQLNPFHQRKGEELSIEEMQALGIATAVGAVGAVETAAQLMAPSIYFAKEIGEMSEKTNGLSEENNRLREKVKALKQKMEGMESQNHKQDETIRNLESSQDKLQKELERVKTEKDRLRIEIEQTTAKNSIENRILTEKLEALTKDFEAVENENKELKRSLEELTNSNHSLKETVDSIREVNKQLEGDMGKLKAEHKKIREKLECKETRLVLGQVAWLLEAEIWKAVLPNQKMGHTGILRSMERWLNKNSSSREGKEAQKRWEDLKGKLKWNEEDHKWALKQLKEIRREDAHPVNVDLEAARKELNEGDYLADADKETCEEIIDMVVTAKKLNSSM